MKYPIFIPSKNRADECYTSDLLKQYNISHYIVVEPQDYEKYDSKYPNLIKLDRDNQGLSYARNFIKKLAKEGGFKYHWQLDDDIKQFQVRENGKNVKKDPLSIFNHIESYIDQYVNIAIAGLRDCVFAWTQKYDVSVNKLVASAFIVRSNTDIRWGKDLIEDVDYCMQSLLSGYCTLIFNRLLYQKKPNAVAKGGQLSDSMKYYELLNKNVVKKYPESFKLRLDKKRGIYKLAPSRVWGTFKQRPGVNVDF